MYESLKTLPFITLMHKHTSHTKRKQTQEVGVMTRLFYPMNE